jgi:hypothetical protein
MSEHLPDLDQHFVAGHHQGAGTLGQAQRRSGSPRRAVAAGRQM